MGGIVINRNFDTALQQKIDRLIKKSIEYAFSNYPELNDYIRKHSQEMSEEVMRKHIDLYVNNYSIDLGEKGKNAIEYLLSVYHKNNSIAKLAQQDIFVQPIA